MLKIENIKISPDQGLGAVSAEAARMLKLREKDLLSLRILRRSIDARDGVALVYTVEVGVKDEAAEGEAWDEFERSIIAKVADDVVVGVKGKTVNISIKKNFN